jgi:ATP-dependent phosphofructokinase / diphosphate-dependent phosphofructokinase
MGSCIDKDDAVASFPPPGGWHDAWYTDPLGRRCSRRYNAGTMSERPSPAHDPAYTSVHPLRIKGRIGILTGGGDVPGLNPAIRAVFRRATQEGYEVLGIRRGWAGLIDTVREPDADNRDNFQTLSEDVVSRSARTGGTFLRTSRTNPAKTSLADVPPWLRDRFNEERNDLTAEVLKNLDWLGVDRLIPIGGDDTLSYGVRLSQEGVPVNAIPKTMDGDVPGTEACIGFSTCVSRTIELVNRLRTSAGSHERFLIVEVFGRYAGFTSLEPTAAGAADRNLIPEKPVPIERVAELLSDDRRSNPSHYAVLLVSEGVTLEDGGMVFRGERADAYGHRQLGGIGRLVAARLDELSPTYNNGRKVGTLVQELGYLVRSGEPDYLDSKLPVAYGNMVVNQFVHGSFGQLMVVKHGRFGTAPLDVVTSRKKVVNVARDYDAERLRPTYENFEGRSLFHITAEAD